MALKGLIDTGLLISDTPKGVVRLELHNYVLIHQTIINQTRVACIKKQKMLVTLEHQSIKFHYV